jgi:surface antigen
MNIDPAKILMAMALSATLMASSVNAQDATQSAPSTGALAVGIGGDIVKRVECAGCAPIFEIGQNGVRSFTKRPAQENSAYVFAARDDVANIAYASSNAALLRQPYAPRLDLVGHRLKGVEGAVFHEIRGLYLVSWSGQGEHRLQLKFRDAMVRTTSCNVSVFSSSIFLTADRIENPKAIGITKEIRLELGQGYHPIRIRIACAGEGAPTLETNMIDEHGDIAPLKLLADYGREQVAPAEEATQSSQPEDDAIIFVQQALNDLGLRAGPIDGAAGWRTINAAKRFASLMKLTMETPTDPDFVVALEQARRNTSYVSFGTEDALVGRPFSNQLRGALSKAHLTEAKKAFAQLLTTRGLKSGTQRQWRSRNAANGVITALDVYRDCLFVRQEITVGGQSEVGSHYVCRTDDGNWSVTH